jgi:hypothetical protein
LSFEQVPTPRPECGARGRQKWALVRGPRHDAPLFYDMLDPKDWEILLEVYKGHPIVALGLAQQFIAIKQSLERGRKGIPDAIKAVELAIESLFPHTEFHKMGHKFGRPDL